MARTSFVLILAIVSLTGCATLETFLDDLDRAGASNSSGEPQATIVATSTTPGLDAAPLPTPVVPGEGEADRVVARGTCGEDLACVDGWHMRLLDISHPGSHVPVRASVPVRIRVQNRGLEASPVGEAHVCFVTSGHANSCPSGDRNLLTLPSVGPGHTVELTLNVPAPASEARQAWTLVALDPDRIWDRGRMEHLHSEPVEIELPKLQFLTVNAGPTWWESRRLPVSGTIRNPSFSATVPAVEILVVPVCLLSGSPPPRVPVPELGPRETYEFEVELNVGTGAHPADGSWCSQGGMTITVDPDRTVNWSRQHENRVSVRYEVRGR